MNIVVNCSIALGLIVSLGVGYADGFMSGGLASATAAVLFLVSGVLLRVTLDQRKQP